MLRIEDKYNMSAIDMVLLEKRLEGIMERDTNNKGIYHISSVYFDDLLETCYNDSLDGNPVRKKYRIRFYNNSLDFIKLEIKEKYYRYGRKMTSMISKAEFDSILNGKIIDDYENLARKDFNIAIKNRGLRPKLIVEYDRTAFVQRSGNVRITLDRNLKYCTNFFTYYNTQESKYLSTEPVLEVKYSELLPKYIAQVLENNMLYKTSNSKYALCMEDRRKNNVC